MGRRVKINMTLKQGYCKVDLIDALSNLDWLILDYDFLDDNEEPTVLVSGTATLDCDCSSCNKSALSSKVSESDSSCIERIQYDWPGRVMTVTFKSGKIYNYFEVSSSTYHNFLDASSKGTFFNINIKGMYKFEQIN